MALKPFHRGPSPQKHPGGAVRAAVNITVLLLALVSVYPLAWMVLSSFKTGKDFAVNVMGPPRDFYWQNYPAAIKRTTMGTALRNTLIVTLAATVCILLFAFLVGYCINRYQFCGRRAVYAAFLVGMLVPAHSFLLPIYLLFSKLHLTNSVCALILPNIAFHLPLAVILIDSFLGGIPYDIDEAAVIDGAGLLQRILLVSLPMCRPILSTLLILNSIWVWNEFPFAQLLLTDTGKRTLPMTIANFQGEFDMDFTPMFAALVLVSLPILVLYACFSEKIMDGMTEGAVKG